MNNQPDQHYIDLILKGKVNSFAILVERYKQMVYTLAIRIVKNKERAEEISQDVFVKAYLNLPKFKGESKFSTWLYKIAYYASLDDLKKNKREVISDTIELVNEKNISHIETALDELEIKERKEIIKKALLKLNPEESTLLTLFYFEESTIKELSEILGLSQDNVKVKLFRSRKKMAKVLQHLFEPNTINLI